MCQGSDNAAWCWGYNFDGELGDGTTTGRPQPAPVAALGNNVAMVAAGMFHTCASKLDGSVWCWGYNNHGQLGDGTTSTRLTPIQVSGVGNDVAQLSLGSSHTCAVRGDASLWCWGENAFGALGAGNTVESRIPRRVSALGNNVAGVATGVGYTCARKTDGSLWCFGNNSSGQVGDGTTTDRLSPVQVSALGTSIAEIVLGGAHSCARKTDGSVWCWGFNGNGQLGDGTTTTRSSPAQVTTLGNNVVELSAGSQFTCARTTDEKVWCWGNNNSGELGDGTTTQRKLPTLMLTLATPVTAPAAAPASTTWSTPLLGLLLVLGATFARRAHREPGRA